MIGLGLDLSLKWRPTGFTGLLNTYGGAAAAYSLRPLSRAWVAGDVIIARRSSDNAELGFTATEITDGTLTAWAGVGDAFVKTWYDQSGNGRNATQTTAANQPQIVAGGSLVADGLNFNGTNSRLDIDGFAPASTYYYALCVNKANAIPATQETLFDTTDAANGGFALNYGATSNRTIHSGFFNTGLQLLNGTINVGTTKRLISAEFKSGASASYLDGTQEATLSSTWATGGTNSFTKSTIGYDQGPAGRDLNSRLGEMIIYLTDQSANRTAIESEVANYYGITLA